MVCVRDAHGEANWPIAWQENVAATSLHDICTMMSGGPPWLKADERVLKLATRSLWKRSQVKGTDDTARFGRKGEPDWR